MRVQYLHLHVPSIEGLFVFVNNMPVSGADPGFQIAPSRGRREIFGVFHVKKSRFYAKKNHIFTNFINFINESILFTWQCINKIVLKKMNEFQRIELLWITAYDLLILLEHLISPPIFRMRLVLPNL